MHVTGPTFISPAEQALADQFIRDGYVIVPVADRTSLDWLRNTLADLTAKFLSLDRKKDPSKFLNGIHNHVTPERLNALRLSVLEGLNANPDTRPRYFSLAQTVLSSLVGNELAMQRRVNLSIQLPGDTSSLLPIHADVLNGDSPFEVVQWTPYVDCHGTKSIFILPPSKSALAFERLSEMSDNAELYDEVREGLVWLTVPYGSTLIFNQNLLHGNVTNEESETRWSSNCRYKSVFTPYADKRLGEFFEPITLKPASQIGMNFKFPLGLHSED